MSRQEQDITNLKTRSRSRSPSPINKNSSDLLSLQKELKDKEHELNIAYQTSLELIETNNELQQHLEEQNSTIEILDANILDCEMKMDMLEAENQEYQQTILQTNDKYEQLLGELAVTREHLNNSNDEISEYQRTIQSLNHDIIHNKQTNNPNNKYNYNNRNNNNSELIITEYKDKLSKQQNKYDELLRECEKLRNESEQLIDLQIEMEDMKKEQMKVEKRNKLLSDKIVELTYNNVQLEKEINDYTLDINEQNETIKTLITENQNLMTKKLITENKTVINQISSEPNKLTIGEKNRLYSSYGGPDTTLSTFVNNKENIDLKRRLSIQLRDNFSDNSKLVMFANTIDDKKIENNNNNNSLNELDELNEINEEYDYNMNECENENENDNEINDNRSIDNRSIDNFDVGSDLFTMVQNYENNDEYLRNAEIEQQEREESLSQLSDKQPIHTQIEEKKSIDSSSPQSNDLILPNKSRHEKAIDKQRKGSKSSTTSLETRDKKSSGNIRRNASSIRNKNNKSNKLSKKRNYSRKTPTYRKTDALDEYLHLTASAVKINYPTVNATSKELIEMVKSLPFYQAHDHLNRYMMERLRWEQIQQNKLLQLKAAAIESQRDHKIAQQSTVTRIFKKWFTTEYDNMDHIVHNDNTNHKNKGQFDLSSPLTKKENFRLNRVGKAKIIQTKSGGTSVNIGSLSKGIPPKNTNRKKRIIKSQHYSSKYNHKYYPNDEKKRKKRDKKLKSLAMTQTLPSSHTHKNDKKVQEMAEIHAKHINQIIQNEAKQSKDKHPKPIKAIKLKDKPKPKYKSKPKDNISNAENHPIDKINGNNNKDRKKKKNLKRIQSQTQTHKQGWVSWLIGAQSQPQSEKKRRKSVEKDKRKKSMDKNEVRDPYALAPVQKKKKRKSVDKNDKNIVKKAKKSKSKSPRDDKMVDKDKDSKQEEVIDIDEHIRNVIRMQDDIVEDEEDVEINGDIEKKNEEELNGDNNQEKEKEKDNVIGIGDDNESGKKVVNDKLTLEKLPEFEADHGDEEVNVNDDMNVIDDKDIKDEDEIRKELRQKDEQLDENKVNDDIVVESNVNENIDSVYNKVNDDIEIKEVEQVDDVKEENINVLDDDDNKNNEIEQVDDINKDNMNKEQNDIEIESNKIEPESFDTLQTNNIKEDICNIEPNEAQIAQNTTDNMCPSESYNTEEEPIDNINQIETMEDIININDINQFETMDDITTQIFDNDNDNDIIATQTETINNENNIKEETSNVSSTLLSPIGSDTNTSFQNLNDKININDLPDITEDNNNNNDDDELTDPYALSPHDNKSEITPSVTPMDDNINELQQDNIDSSDVIESTLADDSDDLYDILQPVQVKDSQHDNNDL